MSQRDNDKDPKARGASRRDFLKTAAVGVAAAAGAPGAAQALAFDIEEFLQKNFRELTEEEIDQVLARLEKKYSKKYGKDVTVDATGPMDGTLLKITGHGATGIAEPRFKG